MASRTVWSWKATGRQRNWRRKRGGRASVSGETAGRSSSVTSGDTELIGERGQHVARGDEAEVDQDFADLFAALFLEFEGAVEVVRQ